MGQTASTPNLAVQSPPAGCPMHEQAAAAPAQCPVQHNSSAAATSIDRPARCPVQHDSPSDALNPLNQMPELSQMPTSSSQSISLPTQRVVSTIPRPAQKGADGYGEGDKWEYPSPQQFYNALVRKGWETPEEHIETMVDIHNFLNEQAWEEVLKWERRCAGAGNRLGSF
jgi:cytochrome c heme-lyase